MNRLRHVTFTRDMKPFRAGERRLVSEDIAAQLAAQGAIAADPPAWPPAETKPVRRRRLFGPTLG